MIKQFTFSIIIVIFLFIGCQVNIINNKSNKIEYIELSQKSQSFVNNVKIYPTYYEILENNKVYKHPLEEGKWAEILITIDSIDYKKINEVVILSNNTSNGRLVVKDLKSEIIIKDKEGIYTSKPFSDSDNINGLNDLFKILESYLPLR